MAEAKPTASLSSGLLARKGAARPAMRRQGLGGHVAAPHDDLGWNDMGHDLDHDEYQSHAAHVAEIMPMLSPMGGKPVAVSAERQASVAAHESRARDAIDVAATPDEADLSPLSVKPGKPQVVRQREALEERVRIPAPSVVSTAGLNVQASEEPLDVHAAPTAGVPEATEVAKPVEAVPVEPVFAERAPTVRPQAPTSAPPRPAPRAPTKSRISRSARPAGAKAAFTLRIDADRHLRLRLASAVTNLSAQQILTEAFDAYMETIPEVEALAGNVARRNSDRS